MQERIASIAPRTQTQKLLAVAAATAALVASGHALARPGTHPVMVSTWDTRASSVALQYRHGFFGSGSLDHLSYAANFTSTSGKLSSQFALHYLNFSESLQERTAHGLAATANAVFNLPVTARASNGVATAAIAFYVGAAPTVLVSGEKNYVSIPVTLGIGVPITPAKVVTLTPWFELSPGVNLDTLIHPFDFEVDNPLDYVTPEGDIRLTEEDVERILSEAVELDVSATVGARAGVDFTLRATDAFDITANAALSSIGTAFAGKRVMYLGGGLVWRWDKVVPAVLPPEKRLKREACDDIEDRFRSCPNARRWRPPPEIDPNGSVPPGQ